MSGVTKTLDLLLEGRRKSYNLLNSSARALNLRGGRSGKDGAGGSQHGAENGEVELHLEILLWLGLTLKDLEVEMDDLERG